MHNQQELLLRYKFVTANTHCATHAHVDVIRALYVPYRHTQDLLEASQACLPGCNGGAANAEGACSKRSDFSVGSSTEKLHALMSAAVQWQHSFHSHSASAYVAAQQLCGMQAEGGRQHGQCRQFRFANDP